MHQASIHAMHNLAEKSRAFHFAYIPPSLHRYDGSTASDQTTCTESDTYKKVKSEREAGPDLYDGHFICLSGMARVVCISSTPIRHMLLCVSKQEDGFQVRSSCMTPTRTRTKQESSNVTLSRGFSINSRVAIHVS